MNESNKCHVVRVQNRSQWVFFFGLARDRFDRSYVTMDVFSLNRSSTVDISAWCRRDIHGTLAKPSELQCPEKCEKDDSRSVQWQQELIVPRSPPNEAERKSAKAHFLHRFARNNAYKPKWSRPYTRRRRRRGHGNDLMAINFLFVWDISR